MSSVALAPGSGRHSHGGPVPLLLPRSRLPRLRQAGTRQSDRLRPLRQGPATSAALLSHLQGPLFRAEGDAPVRFALARGQGHRPDQTPGRSQRRAGHRSAGRRAPRHGGPLQPTPGRARPRTPRRTRGFFPLRPKKSNSTRSGRLCSRNRSTAIPTTRPMSTVEMGGITQPTTPSTGWSCASSPGHAMPRMWRQWWPMSNVGRRVVRCG